MVYEKTFTFPKLSVVRFHWIRAQNIQLCWHAKDQSFCQQSAEQFDVWNVSFLRVVLYVQYLSTIIPYRPSDGRPTIQRLQIYLTRKFDKHS